ncbi:DUF2971 domain-containing protein [Duganella sp. BuS-21]|uniref:DUF2971 domain-containing protein n=1 Tax=Duganella sp. BuS-21 TaxID=2943848 RepID=UPI0035A73246
MTRSSFIFPDASAPPIPVMNAANKPPSSLYKYAAFTAQNLENLKNQAIYFNSPRNFNDPYDCSVTPTIQIPTDVDVDSIRARYLADPTTPISVREQLQRATTERLRQMFMNSAKDVAAAKIKEFSDTRGVSCFSESCDDLLMWAHYGGNYRGFCLEFDTSYFPNLQKVHYSTAMPSFDLVPILKHELEASDFMSMFSSKSLSWAYEREWRAFHAEVGTSYGYPPEVLTGVYFGPEISRAALEIICLILQGQNEGVIFWQGTRNANTFKVDFAQFDYLSYLQAKKART